jgi:hypothetical protein
MNKPNVDLALYNKIREEREKVGLPVTNIDEDLPNHSLIGKSLYGTDTEKEYVVVSAKKQWENGYYEILLLQDKNNSSRMVYWKSINCKDEIILTAIDKAREAILLITDDGYSRTFYRKI